MAFFNDVPVTNNFSSTFTSVHGSQYNNYIGSNQYNFIFQPTDQKWILEQLKPAINASGINVPSCLPGTREQVLHQIFDSLHDFLAPNIVWLHGGPGEGKSAIASTLRENLESYVQPWSSFFCRRDYADLCDPIAIWRTIAYDLAQSSPIFAEKITQNLMMGVDPIKPDIMSQFEHLIEEPLIELWDKSGGSATIVVVIDALDECKNDLHNQFMDTIARWSHLPPSFKLIVTSRDQAPAPFVSHLVTIELNAFARSEVYNDIRKFFTQHFAEIASHQYPRLQSWPGDSIIEQLTYQADGLFIWAETIVRFVEKGFFPEERLALVLDGSFGGARLALDELYSQILHLSFEDTESIEFDVFQRVVGVIVVARTPFHREELIHLLGEPENEVHIRLVLDKLSNVFSTRHSDDRIFFRHLSFITFLTDAQRCSDSRFFIDMEKHDAFLARRCLKIMESGLRFNICDLGSSYRFNREIEDLEERRRSISTTLRYSCLHWAHHLTRISKDAPYIVSISLSLIDFFVHRRFLYWIETLSLLEELQEGVIGLVLVANWIKKVWNYEHECWIPVIQTYKFILEFYDPISNSAPHLYVSALPFAPKYSWISQVCHNVASIVKGKDEDWPAYVRTTKLHFDIRCVTFSWDNVFVAAAGSDNCIQILDAATGVPCRQPFKGHTLPVLCIAFSPDGHYLASGSQDKSIRIWALEDGTVRAKLDGNGGHSDAVFCVTFSPDASTIASGSRNGRVCVWAFVDNETCFFRHEHKDTIRSIAFSPDGQFVASGSHNKSVRVYRVKHGDMILQLLGHHEGRVLSVAFLADGRLVSGSEDRVIRVWNMDSGVKSDVRLIENDDSSTSTALIQARPIYEFTTSYNSANFRPLPPPRPRNTITSFAFSPDGRFVVSGSLGYDIRIWNLETGAEILDPLRGHSSRISSIAISQNSESMVSGSSDERICLWDVKTLFESLGDPVATIHISSPPNNNGKPLHAPPQAERNALMPLPPARLLGEQVDFDVLVRGAPVGRQLHPDGWMRDARKNPVIWVPPQYREHLLCEALTRASTKPVTLSRLVAIDYEALLHGSSWTQLSDKLRSSAL